MMKLIRKEERRKNDNLHGDFLTLVRTYSTVFKNSLGLSDRVLSSVCSRISCSHLGTVVCPCRTTTSQHCC